MGNTVKPDCASPALFIGILGNGLALAWFLPVIFAPRGSYDELPPGLLFALVALLLLAIGVFCCIISFCRESKRGRITAIMGLALCLTPVPLYLYTINLLCTSYGCCSLE